MEWNSLQATIAVIVFLIYLLLIIGKSIWFRTSSYIRFSRITETVRKGGSWRIYARKALPLVRLITIAFLLLALSGIRFGQELKRVAETGVAMHMLIDRSSSMGRKMLYDGQESNRLGVVKQVFTEFILGDEKGFKGRHGDMIALSSFAGFVEHNAPLTLDHVNLVDFARGIRLAQRIEDGTMIGDAIYSSALRMIASDKLLKEEEQLKENYKIASKLIILLTDGEQTRGGMSPIEAALFAKENGIKVYTIAIVDDSDYQEKNGFFGSFFSFGKRQVDTTLLEKVAELTGGQFAKADSGESLHTIYSSIDKLEKTEFTEHFTTYQEMFPLFVMLALGFLFMELIIRYLIAPKLP